MTQKRKPIMTKRRKPTTLDFDKARELYDEGKTDTEIAEACSVQRYSVRNWRRKFGLLSNRPAPVKEKKPKKEKPAKPRSKLSDDAAEARRCGMNYGAWKALQFEEQRRAKLALGKKYVPEEPVKKEEPPKRGNYHTSKPVVCVETGAVYPSIRAAATAFGGNAVNISRSIKNGVRGYGYHWKYAP